MSEREHDDGRCCENGYFGQQHDCAKGCPPESEPKPERAREWLPEISRHVAHPQSVWFETHWRPIFEQVRKERDELLDEVMKLRLQKDPECVENIHKIVVSQLKKTEQHIRADRDLIREERDRYRDALEWVRDGIQHFKDEKQKEHLTRAIDEALES